MMQRSTSSRAAIEGKTIGSCTYGVFPASHRDLTMTSQRTAMILENLVSHARYNTDLPCREIVDLGKATSSTYECLTANSSITKYQATNRSMPIFPNLLSHSLTVTTMLLLPALAALFSLLPFSTSHTPHTPDVPKPPALEYLYTAYVDCLQSVHETQGPSGIRQAIPIVGGNFTGPRGLSGKILDLGEISHFAIRITSCA